MKVVGDAALGTPKHHGPQPAAIITQPSQTGGSRPAQTSGSSAVTAWIQLELHSIASHSTNPPRPGVYRWLNRMVQ